MTNELQHISEEVERELAKLREWGPHDWQLERAIAAAKAATLDNEYDQIEHGIAEQNGRITKLIAAAEVALKEHPSRMFADAGHPGDERRVTQ